MGTVVLVLMVLPLFVYYCCSRLVLADVRVAAIREQLFLACERRTVGAASCACWLVLLIAFGFETDPLLTLVTRDSRKLS
eukprot:scaffold19_cov169-Amphora_coffeaeformis.AAC.6